MVNVIPALFSLKHLKHEGEKNLTVTLKHDPVSLGSLSVTVKEFLFFAAFILESLRTACPMAAKNYFLIPHTGK